MPDRNMRIRKSAGGMTHCNAFACPKHFVARLAGMLGDLKGRELQLNPDEWSPGVSLLPKVQDATNTVASVKLLEPCVISCQKSTPVPIKIIHSCDVDKADQHCDILWIGPASLNQALLTCEGFILIFMKHIQKRAESQGTAEQIYCGVKAIQWIHSTW